MSDEVTRAEREEARAKMREQIRATVYSYLRENRHLEHVVDEIMLEVDRAALAARRPVSDAGTARAVCEAISRWHERTAVCRAGACPCCDALATLGQEPRPLLTEADVEAALRAVPWRCLHCGQAPPVHGECPGSDNKGDAHYSRPDYPAMASAILARLENAK